MFGFRALIVALGAVASAAAIGSPIGFAKCKYNLHVARMEILLLQLATTGGAGGVTVTPTTNDQLLQYLSDSTTVRYLAKEIYETNYSV